MSTEQTPGGPESPAPGADRGTSGHHPRTGTDFFGWIRSLRVTRGSDRWAGGVASGLAHRWGVDPVIVRGLFIVAAIFLGVGVLAYGILWLLLPEPDGRIHLQEAGHGRWTAGMTGGLLTTILGLGGARAGFWFGDIRGAGFLWGLFWVGAVCLVCFSIVRSRRARRMSRSFESAAAPGQGPVPPSSSPHAPGPYPGGPYVSGPYVGGQYAGPYASPATAPMSASTTPMGAGTAPTARTAASMGGATRTGGAARQTVVRPWRRGPGGPYTAVVLGLAVLVSGGLLALGLTGAAVVDPSTGALWAIGAAIIGLGVIVAGLRGRTAGLLSLFAIMALIAAAVTQPVSQFSRPRGSVNFVASSVQQATAGYKVTGASGQLDLRALDSAGPLASESVVPVDATMSQLEIRIPKDVPVRVETDATMSNVQFGDRSASGFTTTNSETYNQSRPGSTLVVKVDATMSNIVIDQEQ